MNSLEKRFTWWDWGIEGNYVLCLDIVVIFVGLKGAKKWGDFLNSSFWMASHKGGTSFYGRGSHSVFSLYNTDILKF